MLTEHYLGFVYLPNDDPLERREYDDKYMG